MSFVGPRSVLVGAPVQPDGRSARELVERELQEPAYGNVEPGLLQRIWESLSEGFSSVGLNLPLLGWAVLLVLLVVAALVVARVAGPLRTAARTAQAARPVFADESISAAEHRRRADDHAASGRWEQAVQERFRALVRDLEERTLLDPRPGRTADEAAAEAAVVLPSHAAPLEAAARVFDDISYGGRTASAAQHEQVRALDAVLAQARPTLPPGPSFGASLTVPR